MSEEDDSMGDSMLEDELEDEESSSESMDEEIKLTNNFMDALARIQTNNLYDDYLLLVSLVFTLLNVLILFIFFHF